MIDVPNEMDRNQVREFLLSDKSVDRAVEEFRDIFPEEPVWFLRVLVRSMVSVMLEEEEVIGHFEMPHKLADYCVHAGVGKACKTCRDLFDGNVDW